MAPPTSAHREPKEDGCPLVHVHSVEEKAQRRSISGFGDHGAPAGLGTDPQEFSHGSSIPDSLVEKARPVENQSLNLEVLG